MRVRIGACGHVVAEDAPAVVLIDPVHGDREGYICEDCRSRAVAPRVETKDVQPGQRVVDDPYELGRLASSEDECPYPDRRTKEAKAWLAGWREGHGEQKDGT